mgnify:CR=1 FL=1
MKTTTSLVIVALLGLANVNCQKFNFDIPSNLNPKDLDGLQKNLNKAVQENQAKIDQLKKDAQSGDWKTI